MLGRRFHLSGMLAVLLALMAQLGMGATVPRIDPIAGSAVLCHTDQNTPSRPPTHSTDCVLCPLCGMLHTQAVALLPVVPVLTPPAVLLASRTVLPPPSAAPPARRRPPGQPRAPPVFS